MTRPSATSSIWKLDGTKATFDDGRLQARVDLLRPQFGLQVPAFTDQSLGAECGALGVDIGKVADDDLSLPETYARVDDLVATYLQTESRPFRIQAYWRRVDASPLSGLRDATVIELQVSINTSLLDTHPSIQVRSNIPGTLERSAAARGYTVTRTAGGRLYFEAVHPADERLAHDATGSPGAPGSGAATRAYTLFGDFLEKGVIVRARIRAAFLPAGATAADCAALYDAFVNEPLPLTT